MFVETAHVTAMDLRAEYETWCRSEGEKPRTTQAVGRELKKQGFDTKQMGKSRARTWIGIGLRSTESEHL